MNAGSDLQRTVEVDLAGRTVLVTGAASGIGRACARRLAAAGAKALVVDRDADGVRSVADEVAELVAYLCSAAASFVTGASIVMDGGWSAH
jgi:3-hydroxybutyrate dehydrogenase